MQKIYFLIVISAGVFNFDGGALFAAHNDIRPTQRYKFQQSLQLKSGLYWFLGKLIQVGDQWVLVVNENSLSEMRFLLQINNIYILNHYRDREVSVEGRLESNDGMSYTHQIEVKNLSPGHFVYSSLKSRDGEALGVSKIKSVE